MCKQILPSNHFFFPIVPYVSVGFLSRLDNAAFSLAKGGRFGPVLEAETTEIEKLPLPRCIFRKNKHVRYFWTVFTTCAVLLGLTMSVLVIQKSKHKWTTKTLRVQFQEQTGLQAYNGCYQMNDASEGTSDQHHAYNNVDNNKDQTAFGYCFDERRWVLFKDNSETNACMREQCNNGKEPSECNNTGELMHSSKTDTFYTCVCLLL